jgi:Mn-dependent DtxR family transcriptional regulator
LSPEATDKICTFLGHPRSCPHGAPIPPGPCCGGAGQYDALMKRLEHAQPGRRFTRDDMNER